MAIVMNMSSYEIERTPVEPSEAKMTSSAESYLAINQIELQQFVPSKRQGIITADLARLDVENFLQRMEAN
jgi:hypothetical protein